MRRLPSFNLGADIASLQPSSAERFEYEARCYFEELDRQHDYGPLIQAAELCLAFLAEHEDALELSTDGVMEEALLTDFITRLVGTPDTIDCDDKPEDAPQKVIGAWQPAREEIEDSAPNQTDPQRRILDEKLFLSDLTSFVLRARAIKKGGKGVCEIPFSPRVRDSSLFDEQDRQVMCEIRRSEKPVETLPPIFALNDYGYVIGERKSPQQNTPEESEIKPVTL